MLITLFSIILWLSCLQIYTYLFKQINTIYIGTVILFLFYLFIYLYFIYLFIYYKDIILQFLIKFKFRG